MQAQSEPQEVLLPPGQWKVVPTEVAKPGPNRQVRHAVSGPWSCGRKAAGLRGIMGGPERGAWPEQQRPSVYR